LLAAERECGGWGGGQTPGARLEQRERGVSAGGDREPIAALGGERGEGGQLRGGRADRRRADARVGGLGGREGPPAEGPERTPTAVLPPPPRARAGGGGWGGGPAPGAPPRTARARALRRGGPRADRRLGRATWRGRAASRGASRSTAGRRADRGAGGREGPPAR